MNKQTSTAFFQKRAAFLLFISSFLFIVKQAKKDLLEKSKLMAWVTIGSVSRLLLGSYSYSDRVWNCNQLVASATEEWLLASSILRLVTIGWLTLSVLNGLSKKKTLCLVSIKKLTPCLLKVINFIENNLDQNKMTLKTVTIHAL